MEQLVDMPKAKKEKIRIRITLTGGRAKGRTDVAELLPNYQGQVGQAARGGKALGS